MSDKTFKIVGNDISDGYHTFDELYDHRCLLFIAWLASDGCPGKSYWLKDHFKGWDLLGVYIEGIGQISYHIPEKYRDLYAKRVEEIKSHEWDGHLSADVITRLQQWISR